MEAEHVDIQEPCDNLSLCEFLPSVGVDANKFNIPLEFWLNLNTITDNEWFVLTNEMINLIGFQSSKSKHHNSASDLFAFIRKHFIEGLDFSRNGRESSHHQIEIQMKKRSFKKLLLKVETSTSETIHDYLLDIRTGCMKYALYQEQCKTKSILEEHRKLKRLKIEEGSSPNLDLSLFPEISVQSYDKLSVVYLIYLKHHHALKFGISNNIVVRIQQHCMTLGSKQGDVKLVYILRSSNLSSIESSLKHYAILNGWKKDDIFLNGALQSEIIVLNKTTIQTVIDVIVQFNEQHEKEEDFLKKSNEMEKFRIQSELESKRLDLELKRIELESKKLDIKKLEIESKTS